MRLWKRKCVAPHLLYTDFLSQFCQRQNCKRAVNQTVSVRPILTARRLLRGFALPQNAEGFNNFLAELANASWRCEQGGSQGSRRGSTGDRCPEKQPQCGRRSRPKNRHDYNGQNPTTRLCLAWYLLR